MPCFFNSFTTLKVKTANVHRHVYMIHNEFSPTLVPRGSIAPPNQLQLIYAIESLLFLILYSQSLTTIANVGHDFKDISQI